MKKLISILTAVVLIATSFATVAFADEGPAKAEVLFPERTFLATPQSYVIKHQLVISDAVSTDLAANPELQAVKKMDGKIIKARHIHTLSNVTADTTARFGDTRVRMTGDWDGTFRFKRPFTYEFDFTVNKLDSYLMLAINDTNGCVTFVRDKTTENQYCLSWDVNDDAEISGKALEFGKTYNLRIEADMTKGGKIFTIFTDPETGEYFTSSTPSGMTSTEEQLATLTNRYYVMIDFEGVVDIDTDNEIMNYEAVFVRAHDLTLDTEANKVSTKVSILNALNKVISRVPLLYLTIYDENDNLAASKMFEDSEITIPKQSGEGGEKLDAPLLTYTVDIDASTLNDGKYTAKSFLWRSAEEMYVMDVGVTQTFTVKDGKIVDQPE